MTEEEKIKLARECAAGVRPHSHNSALIRNGERDGTDIVQSALAAINAFAPRPEQAEELLREVEAQFRFYGDNHAAKPDPVKAKTNYYWADRIAAFLGQGDAS